MRRLRAGLIGSIRAWLPSRRSTAHHIGARSTILSGHVRSNGTDAAAPSGLRPTLPRRRGDTGRPASTSRVGCSSAGWPGFGGPDGVVTVRTDVKASGESGAGLEKVVTMIAPGCRWNSRPAHREHPRREAGLDQTPSRLPRRSTRCTPATVSSERGGRNPGCPTSLPAGAESRGRSRSRSSGRCRPRSSRSSAPTPPPDRSGSS